MYNADLHAPARWRLRAVSIGTGCLIATGLSAGLASTANAATSVTAGEPKPAPMTKDEKAAADAAKKAAEQDAKDQKAADEQAKKDQKAADDAAKKAADQAAKDQKAADDAAKKAADQAAKDAKNNPPSAPPSDNGNGNGNGGSNADGNSDGGQGPGSNPTDDTAGNGGNSGQDNNGTGNDGGTGNNGDNGNHGTGNNGDNGNHGTGNDGDNGNHGQGNNGNGVGGVGGGNNGGNGNHGTGNDGDNGNHGTGNNGDNGNHGQGNNGGNGNHGNGNNGKSHKDEPVTSVVFGDVVSGPTTGPENWLPFSAANNTTTTTVPLSMLWLSAAGNFGDSVLPGTETHVLGVKFTSSQAAPSVTEQLSANALVKAFDKKAKARATRVKASGPSSFNGSALTSGTFHNAGNAVPLLALLLLVEILIIGRRMAAKVRRSSGTGAVSTGAVLTGPGQVRWA